MAKLKLKKRRRPEASGINTSEIATVEEGAICDLTADAITRLDPNEAYRDHLVDIVREVAVERPAYTALLSRSELELALVFLHQLTGEEQGVVARLKLRKGPWFRLSAVGKYLETPREVWSVVSSLESKKVMERPKEREELLQVVQTLFTLSEQKQLLVKVGGRLNHKNKGMTFEAIRNVACNQKTLFGKRISIGPAINSVAKCRKGPFAVRLSPALSQLLDRCTALHYLFDLHMFAIGYPRSTSSIHPGLMVKFKKMRFAGYKCDQNAAIFPSRLHLTQLERAMHLYVRMDDALADYDPSHISENNLEIENVPSIMCTQQNTTDDLVKMLDQVSFRNPIALMGIAGLYLKDLLTSSTCPNLPAYLTRFRAESVLCKVVFNGVTVLEQARKYDEAVAHLQMLLDQDWFCHSSRGKWWNRLAINLKHLKKKEEAAVVCNKALNDPLVHEQGGYFLEAKKRLCRLDVSQREIPSSAQKESCDTPIPQVFVEGKAMNNVVGAKSKFVSNNDKGIVTCSVEALALEYWEREDEGSWTGLHCESKPFRCLFTLFLWDVIFNDEVPFVFLTPYQRGPLDLLEGGRIFWENRKQLVEDRLKEINKMDSADLILEVQRRWQEKQGRLVVGVDWEGQSCHSLQCIAACLGQCGVVAILQQMCQDYGHFASGMPDLMLCRIVENNTNKNVPIRTLFPHFGERFSGDQDVEISGEAGIRLSAVRFECMLVEVKGPNDRLAPKQEIWLQSLIKHGVDARVCKVDVLKENGTDMNASNRKTGKQ